MLNLRWKYEIKMNIYTSIPLPSTPGWRPLQHVFVFCNHDSSHHRQFVDQFYLQPFFSHIIYYLGFHLSIFFSFCYRPIHNHSNLFTFSTISTSILLTHIFHLQSHIVMSSIQCSMFFEYIGLSVVSDPYIITRKTHWQSKMTISI